MHQHARLVQSHGYKDPKRHEFWGSYEAYNVCEAAMILLKELELRHSGDYDALVSELVLFLENNSEAEKAGEDE